MTANNRSDAHNARGPLSPPFGWSPDQLNPSQNVMVKGKFICDAENTENDLI